MRKLALATVKDIQLLSSLSYEKKQKINVLTENGKFSDFPIVVRQVVEMWRTRQSYHREEKSLTLRIKSICRRLCPMPNEKLEFTKEGRPIFKKNPEADKLYDALIGKGTHELTGHAMFACRGLLAAREVVKNSRAEFEKRLSQLAKDLPAHDWCERVTGISPNLLIAVVGEAPGVNYRSLMDFDNPYRLYKRLGLAVMPDGTRQRKVAGDEALAMGYKATRRSMVWTFGNTILRGQAGPFYKRFLEIRKEQRQEWWKRNVVVCPAEGILKIEKATSLEEKEQIYLNALRKKIAIVKKKKEEKVAKLIAKKKIPTPIELEEADNMIEVDDNTTPLSINAETVFRNEAHFNNHTKRLMEKELLAALWEVFRYEAGGKIGDAPTAWAFVN